VNGFAHKFFLAVAAAIFRPRDFCGGEMRAGVKSAGQSFAARKRLRFSRKVGENGLRHVLRKVRVAADLPERGGINEIHMAFHQFGEGIFGICPGKSPKQFGIGRHFSFNL
jgi:hypothetical protein